MDLEIYSEEFKKIDKINGSITVMYKLVQNSEKG